MKLPYYLLTLSNKLDAQYECQFFLMQPVHQLDDNEICFLERECVIEVLLIDDGFHKVFIKVYQGIDIWLLDQFFDVL